MKNAAVDLQDVWVRYGDNTVLSGVTLTVTEGDFLGIIGPNGGGKSTLLKALLGLVKPARGIVRVFGEEPRQSRMRIGYVPQYSQLDRNFPISVRDAVLMGRIGRKKLLQRYGREDFEAAEEALSIAGMENHADRQIGQLSGGQLQRVLVARALVSRPDMLLLDEPTTGVDVAAQEGLSSVLNKLKGAVTIIMVTHDTGVLAASADKVACLSGRLYYHDSKELLPGDLEEAYRCPVDLIAHGAPHRVLKEHGR